MKQYKSHIIDIIYLTMSRIDVKELEHCMEIKAPTKEYEDLLEFLDQARQNYNIENIAILRPVKNGDDYDVMMVASGLLHEERLGISRKKGYKVPLLGDMIGNVYPAGFPALMYDDMLSRHDIKFNKTVSKYGRTYNGVTVICNRRYQGVAILAVGVSLKDIDSMRLTYLIVISVCVVLLSAFFSVTMLKWLQKRVIFPLKEIEDAASSFALRSRNQRNPDALVLRKPDIKTGDELESLADTLVTMSMNMKEYVEALLVTSVEMDNMKQNISTMADIAFRDALTGVKNKAAYDKAKEKLDEKIKTGTAEFGILMIDINFLKNVNDKYGHEKGDVYIKGACGVICEIFVHSPVYRVGGDEFIVILQNSDLINSEGLIKKTIKKFADLSCDKTLEPWERFSAAIGAAFYVSESDDSVDSVFKRSDELMYQNKKAMKAERK